MSLLQRIRDLTRAAQPYIQQRDAAEYGLAALQYPPSAKLAEYALGSGQQEPILQLPEGTLPSGSYVCATLRGDAALVTREIAHVDIDDQQLPPDYRYRMPENELAELLADRVDHAWMTHVGQPPDWIQVYETFAGWRILTPWHSEAHLAALTIPGCDPRYCYVTHRQGGLHRIRLLPKPWRDDEKIVADLVLVRGDPPTGDAGIVLRFHNAVCCATVGAEVCN